MILCWLFGHKTSMYDYGFMSRTFAEYTSQQQKTHFPYCVRCLKKVEQ